MFQKVILYLSPAGFEPARNNTIELKSNALDRSAKVTIQLASVSTVTRYATKRLEYASKKMSPAGFEPARTNPLALETSALDRSAKVTINLISQCFHCY